jgi:sphingomyelin phosphodiesterase
VRKIIYALLYDAMVFSANITAPSYQTKPEWFSYYRARELYGPYTNPPLQAGEPLDAKFFHRLTVSFQNNE